MNLWPNPDTDASRLLLDLLAHHPNPSYDCNSRLGMTAHSRACDLRDRGWHVASTTKRVPRRRKKTAWGYTLSKLPSLHRDDVPAAYRSSWDRAVIGEREAKRGAA